jgi:hypothetical protein
MPCAAAHHDLLVGLLALNNDLVGRADLATALRDPEGRPVAEVLVATGALTAPRRDLLAALAAEHVRRHGGDVTRSLAGLTAGLSTRERIERVGDPSLTESLAHVGATLSQGTATDPERTGTFAAGAASGVGTTTAAPAVSGPPAARQGGARRGVRRAGRRAEPRGRAEADPGPPR